MSAGLHVGLAVVASLALSACDPIESYRSATGVNRNDPDPQASLFTGNMTEAEARPYPNLATVPEPPTSATSSAERQKLAQKLVEERAATQASAALPPELAALPQAQANTAAGDQKLAGDKKTAAKKPAAGPAGDTQLTTASAAAVPNGATAPPSARGAARARQDRGEPTRPCHGAAQPERTAGTGAARFGYADATASDAARAGGGTRRPAAAGSRAHDVAIGVCGHTTAVHRRGRA